MYNVVESVLVYATTKQPWFMLRKFTQNKVCNRTFIPNVVCFLTLIRDDQTSIVMYTPHTIPQSMGSRNQNINVFEITQPSDSQYRVWTC